mmetsp:Transcript_160880/g.516318  ORF Transcript_160880/g.516318 Transcript_160880/m.516318 type:complete len:236 (-) Transcript_160880:785-1492(-)
MTQTKYTLLPGLPHVNGPIGRAFLQGLSGNGSDDPDEVHHLAELGVGRHQAHVLGVRSGRPGAPRERLLGQFALPCAIRPRNVRALLRSKEGEGGRRRHGGRRGDLRERDRVRAHRFGRLGFPRRPHANHPPGGGGGGEEQHIEYDTRRPPACRPRRRCRDLRVGRRRRHASAHRRRRRRRRRRSALLAGPPRIALRERALGLGEPAPPRKRTVGSGELFSPGEAASRGGCTMWW